MSRGSSTECRRPPRKVRPAAPRPSRVWPQTRLPAVTDPKITVRKIPSPRARHQPGRQSIADTSRPTSTIVHDAPARTDAHTARMGSREKPNRTKAAARPTVPRATMISGPKCLRIQHQDKRAEHRAGADDREQDAIEFGTHPRLIARDERQQRSIGAGERIDRNGSDQRRPQIHVAGRMSNPGFHGAHQAFAGLAGRGARRRPPPDQRGDRGEIGGAEYPIRRRGTQSRQGEPRKQRASCAADIVAHAIGGVGAVEIARRHEQRSDRQPRGRRHGPA